MSGTEERVRVLVADDDTFQRQLARAMLSNAGFEVQAVASGNAAVAACARSMPDIVLLDVEMPDGSGFEACAAIRALPGGLNVPIVMVTGLDDERSINLAYDAGATDFVVKPVNWPLFIHRLRYVLRGARMREQLWLSEQKNAALLRVIPDGIFLVDADGTIVHCFSPIEGLAADVQPDGTCPRRLLDLLPRSAHAPALECLEATLRGSPAAFEFRIEQRGRRTRHFECRYLPNGSGQVLSIFRDITARKETEARIHRLAYFDALTGLPNREWLGEYLSQALAEARDRGYGIAVLYVDLDQFKRINDTLGHETGDALLRMAAKRLAESLGCGDPDTPASPRSLSAGRMEVRIARVGGDEFVVVLAGCADEMRAQRVAETIRSALASPFVYGGYEFVVTPSVGIALFPEHGSDVQTLLKNADGAMYEAKASGRNQYRVYTSAMNARALKRLSLELELRRAFESSQLDVYYQPKYDAKTLTIVGAEALLRWFHPDRGQIPTSDFIAVAEEIGLIGEIGRWTMQRVCSDLSRWRAQGIEPPFIAVNVSARDFLRPEALLRLADVVEAASLSPAHFELELTESVLMQDAEAGRRALLTLKELGFALAIDDFGTGYCSLGYLKRFPLDTLKIDRSFVADIDTDQDDAAIVRAIIALARNLELRIVAEGVTTREQLEFLRAEGCDAIQGFLMSPAVSATSFSRLMREAVSAGPRETRLIRRATAQRAG
jgi:predicted signal transduction protein with EAL and GGDEF domain/CheY-like chemotaxis protein